MRDRDWGIVMYNYRGLSGRTMLLFRTTQGGSPGLKDNAPLALKEGPDFSLGVSISSKARVSIAKTGVRYIPGRAGNSTLHVFILSSVF